MKTKILLFALACMIAIGTMAQRHGGKVIEESMNSEILKREKNYCVYLPKSYEKETDRSYPVLYLLHGLTNNYKSWRDLGDIGPIANQIINAGNANEMIIIMPDAGTDYDGYFNCGDKWRYEDFFFTEFMPTVEKKYRIKADKEHRAIAGLSMGGGGTLGYAMHHPELFSSAFAMSAYMGARSMHESISHKNERGEAFTQSVIENNCQVYLENADEDKKAALRTVRWFLDCGDDDFLFFQNVEYIKTMKMARIPVQFRVRDGIHDWCYWQESLFIALPFISNGFAK